MNAKLKKRRAARVGRKPTQGAPRSNSGRIVKAHRKPVETQEQVLATVLAQPHRKGSGDSRSRFLGYSLGRLFFAGHISKDQHAAGEWYGQLWLTYHRRITGITPPKVSAHLQEFVARSDAPISHANDDDDPEGDLRIRTRWQRVQSALADAGKLYQGNSLLPLVCIHDRDASTDQIGELRELLNILCRLREKRP